MIGALVGPVLGIICCIVGLIVGPIVGGGRRVGVAACRKTQAARAGIAAGIGFVLAVLARLGLAIAILDVFANLA